MDLLALRLEKLGGSHWLGNLPVLQNLNIIINLSVADIILQRLLFIGKVVRKFGSA